MDKWLVTGAAGYIGTHVSQSLVDLGIHVVGVDNLSAGLKKNLDPNIEFHNLDIRNFDSLKVLMRDISGVMHLAGYKHAARSVDEPQEAFSNNLEGTESVLRAMKTVSCNKIIFSSTCAIYGSPTELPVKESTPPNPSTPYAQSKLLAEEAIIKSGLNYILLRYFNVVGSGLINVEDQSPYNLFPIILSAWQKKEVAHITGADFPTPDGTAIRDYIHIDDIVSAHLKSIDRLNSGLIVKDIYNLSLGQGISVLQVMKQFKKSFNNEFTFDYTQRRKGDPACIYGSAELAESQLLWKAEKRLEDMVESAILARKNSF